MTYAEFLTRVIDEGRDAAKADYAEPRDRHKLQGSLHGFEDCRGASPSQLVVLHQVATNDAETRREGLAMNFGTFYRRAQTYWYYRCRAVEIEWVVNCVSALLVNEGHTPLLPWLPTASAVLKAAEILNNEPRS